MMEPGKLKNGLLNFKGSEVFYQYEVLWVEFVYTEGIKFLCDNAECYWLMNLIASWQHEIKEEDRVFQVWELKKVTGNGWLVLCTDGNNRELCRQELAYSDFPLPGIIVWLVDGGVLMLPYEY
jgi:hypothetical protein